MGALVRVTGFRDHDRVFHQSLRGCVDEESGAARLELCASPPSLKFCTLGKPAKVRKRGPMVEQSIWTTLERKHVRLGNVPATMFGRGRISEWLRRRFRARRGLAEGSDCDWNQNRMRRRQTERQQATEQSNSKMERCSVHNFKSAYRDDRI